MKIRILISSLIVISSCSSSVSNSKDSINSSSTAKQSSKVINPSNGTSSETIKKDQLFGAWTDGSAENATFNIEEDSIFYVDEMISYPYTLKGDSLTIVYADMSFQGIARFFGDTLVLSDPEFGTTKYTRFKN